jgi:hypothetical protein
MTDAETVDLVTTISEDGSEVVVPMPVARATSDVVRMDALSAALARAGTLVLSREEQDALAAPFPQSVEAVLPRHGLRYIPHIHIRRRLNQVLGTGQWVLVRLREWMDQHTGILYGSYALIVRGVWVGDTVAGGGIPGGNALLDYGDALEGTAGIAIRRIAAKALGCGDQVWDRAPTSTQAQQPPAAPQQPVPAPANGKPAKRPPTDPARLAELLHTLEGVAAGFGTPELSRRWAAMSKWERIDLQAERDRLKQIAACTDGEIAARGSIDE